MGLDSKDIAEVIKAEKEENKDFDIDPIISKFKENQKVLSENDAELAEKFALFLKQRKRFLQLKHYL